MKPSPEVPPDEIARRTGGSLEYFRGRPFRIDYREMGAMINIDGDGYVDEVVIFGIGKEVKFGLDHTIAVLGGGSITFVEPVYRHSEFSGDRRFSWVTISEEEGLTSHYMVVGEREPYPEIMRKLQIAYVAGLAEAELKKSK